MSDVFPILCLACRRLKIKCNRRKPCYQCVRRHIVCEFPSTYRNAAIYSDGGDAPGDHYHRDNHDEHAAKLKEDYHNLEMYNKMVMDENISLVQKNRELLAKLEQRLRSGNSQPAKRKLESKPKDDDQDDYQGLSSGSAAITILGETSELGDKFYGPQLSSFMIENLKLVKTGSDEKAKDEVNGTEFKEMTKQEEFAETMKRNKNSNTPNKSDQAAKLIEESLVRKELPHLIDGLHLSDDDDPNLAVIRKLVQVFFLQNAHYQTFINRSKVMKFLGDYKSIKDDEWENDDDLLLLYMILMLLVQRLTAHEFEHLGLLQGQSISTYNRTKKRLTRDVLFFHFERLRHNLINESIITIQLYILCTEWYLIEQRYEESWSMMFHTCLIAYAIGLHAMRKLRFQSVTLHIHKKNLPIWVETEKSGPPVPKAVGAGSVVTNYKPNRGGLADMATVSSSNSGGLGTNSAATNIDTDYTDATTPISGNEVKGEVVEADDNELEEQETDIERFKVWFALKHVCGQICLVLGRPNPILIQVNSIVLKLVSDTNLSKIDLRERNTQVLLKTGLSECLRLSNMMLIENFMIDFHMSDLMTLDAKFRNEIELLEWYQDGSRDRIASQLTDLSDDSGQEESDFPLDIDSNNVLIDLIVLYINRAKLFEPFVAKFTSVDEAKVISLLLRHSLVKFLDYTILFIDKFISEHGERYDELSESEKPTPETNRKGKDKDLTFGKLFRIFFPFLNSFVYQGIIVMFTFLHYNFKDFVNYDAKTQLGGDDSLNHNALLHVFETRLNSLLSFGRASTSTRIWLANIMDLIDKIKQHIQVIYQKQKKRAESDREIFEKELNDFHDNVTNSQLEDFFGFNISDPFWLKNPDNFPYYLSSPSESSAQDLQVSRKSRANPTEAVQTPHGQPCVQPVYERLHGLHLAPPAPPSGERTSSTSLLTHTSELILTPRPISSQQVFSHQPNDTLHHDRTPMMGNTDFGTTHPFYPAFGGRVVAPNEFPYPLDETRGPQMDVLPPDINEPHVHVPGMQMPAHNFTTPAVNVTYPYQVQPHGPPGVPVIDEQMRAHGMAVEPSFHATLASQPYDVLYFQQINPLQPDLLDEPNGELESTTMMRSKRQREP